MLKSISLIAIVAAMAFPAAAEGIRVNLKGKSEEVIRADIQQAAIAVCRDAVRKDPIVYGRLSTCTRNAVEAAYAARPARSPSAARTAQNTAAGS